MENKITISVKAYGISHSAVLSDECSADEFIEVCAKMAESIGFTSTLVIKGLEKSKKIRR